MGKYSIENIRNVAITGHAGKGKTTLAEAMLFVSGATDRLGRVAEGNTILDFDACSKKSMINAFSVFSLEYKEEMFDVFYKKNKELWEEVERGNLTVPKLYEIRWNTIFELLGTSADGIAVEKVFHKGIEEGYEKMEGAEEFLSYLSAKFKVYAASNAPYHQQKTRLYNAELLTYFSDLFVSEEIGFQKPSFEFFDYCIKALNLKPEEIIIIGDSLTADIKGGIAAGLKTCWFNPKKAPLPEGVKPDFQISDLREIKNIL